MTVLSIGDESVKNSLKNCLAVGADYAYLAANDAYQSADPEIIAKELKAAKEAIKERTGKKFDIVFCGKETTDFASGQVGTILAKELSAPVTADVVDITAGEGKVTVKQETEEGYCMIESGLPCVVAWNRNLPSIKGSCSFLYLPPLFICSGIFGQRSVSYTHLDVYKRQVYKRCLKQILTYRKGTKNYEHERTNPRIVRGNGFRIIRT